MSISIYTYENPRGRACIDFGDESRMAMVRMNEYGYFREVKVIRTVAKYETALRFVNKLAVQKRYEIAG